MNQSISFPNGTKKALTLSYDDGVIQDQKLVSLMDKYGIKGTFNLNGGLFSEEGKPRDWYRLTKAEAVSLFKNSPHEVASHSLTHPYLNKLTYAEAYHEITADRRTLKELFDCPIRGMAYPFGTYNDITVEAVKDAGICYSRTVEEDNSFRLPTDWLRLTATCHHDDPNMMALLDKFLTAPATGTPLLFYLWGHSYEFDENNNWDLIEAFFQKVSRRDDIWYATNIEIYDRCKI